MSDTLAAALTRPSDMAGTTTGRRCRVGHILDTVTPDNRAAILDHLYGATIDSDLARMLRAGEQPVGTSTLAKHRHGACICDPRPTDEPIERTR